MHRIQWLGTSALVLGVLAGTASGCSVGLSASAPPPHAQQPVHHTQQPRSTPQPTQTPTAPTPSAPVTPVSSAPVTSAVPSAPASTGADASDPAIAPSSPAVSPTSGTSARLVRYGSNGVTVHSAADAGKLRGTSAAFRRFVVASVPQGAADCSAGGSVTVDAWRADGFAVGDVFECPGGYRAIWGTQGGDRWHQLIGSQDVWSCTDLRRYSVPTSIAGDKCYGQGKLQDYRQA
ncbi:MAG TPA: hypothetical protein VFM09_00825 [Marmoricola sp.]|nr:hypothetical protein [Marmoricola sp.]